ncbi:MAG TPA: DUF4349 domain-containing protein [Candidatus Nanoarchaeia archaeon]|nr:DUF4349 domain-containing protein [Candidatus Nanoarchaeia archaeon]
MTVKEQFTKIKENWLIVLLLAIVLVLFMGLPAVDTVQQGLYQAGFGERAYGGIAADSKMGIGMPSPIMPPYYNNGFAPEVQDRQITKTASVTLEVERGTFHEAENKLKAIVTTTDAILLNENAQKYDDGNGRNSYFSGSYTIKVESGKYDAVVSQLKQIGEVTWFTESKDDITQQFVDLQSQLTSEKERLARYQQMLKEATTVEDKIQLSDRIFEQERTIKYLEEQLKNTNTLVTYSTIYVNLNEKRSEYVDAVFVKFSELITKFVNSLNNLLKFIVGLIPYAIVALLAWLGWKKYQKNQNNIKKK